MFSLSLPFVDVVGRVSGNGYFHAVWPFVYNNNSSSYCFSPLTKGRFRLNGQPRLASR